MAENKKKNVRSVGRKYLHTGGGIENVDGRAKRSRRMQRYYKSKQ